MPAAQELEGQELVGGAEGELLYTDVGLSFWGGVDPLDGVHGLEVGQKGLL